MDIYNSLVRIYYKLFVNEHKLLKREKKNPRIQELYKGGTFLGLHNNWGIIAGVSIFIGIIIIYFSYY